MIIRESGHYSLFKLRSVAIVAMCTLALSVPGAAEARKKEKPAELPTQTSAEPAEKSAEPSADAL